MTRSIFQIVSLIGALVSLGCFVAVSFGANIPTWVTASIGVVAVFCFVSGFVNKDGG